MSGARRISWGRVFVAVAAAAACRSHESVCDEALCSDGAVGGGAGAPSTMQDRPGGAAGARPEPECRRDSDCANDSLCDGAERCVSGKCEEGSALECEHGTACVESGDERCVYEAPSPWLLVTATDSLRGLPVAELGKRELITLVDRPREQVLQGFDRVFWPADGKVALVRSLEREFGYRMELLRFGAGVPGPLVPLPDVPTWGDIDEAPQFSRDSARAFVLDGYSGLYLVDLTEAATPTRLIAPPHALDIVWFCDESSSWLQRSSGEYLWSQATLSDGEIATRELGAGWPVLSPDGGLIAMELQDEDEETLAVHLTSCSAGAWSVDYPETTSAAFSDDSRLLLLQLAGGAVKVLSLEDPSAPVEIWSDLDASDWGEPSFVSGAHGPLVRYLKGEDDAVQLVDPSTGTEVPSLELHPDAVVAANGASSLLLWSSSFVGEPRDLLWQSITPNVPPVVVLSDPNDDTSEVMRCPVAGAVLIARRLPGAQETELSFLRFDGELGELELVATFPGAMSRLTWASDDSGAAITTQGAIIDNDLFWLPWSAEGPGKATLIAERALSMEFQPWP